jgi:hypothetical protein
VLTLNGVHFFGRRQTHHAADSEKSLGNEQISNPHFLTLTMNDENWLRAFAVMT